MFLFEQRILSEPKLPNCQLGNFRSKTNQQEEADSNGFRCLGLCWRESIKAKPWGPVSTEKGPGQTVGDFFFLFR